MWCFFGNIHYNHYPPILYCGPIPSKMLFTFFSEPCAQSWMCQICFFPLNPFCAFIFCLLWLAQLLHSAAGMPPTTILVTSHLLLFDGRLFISWVSMHRAASLFFFFYWSLLGRLELTLASRCVCKQNAIRSTKIVIYSLR